MAAHPDRLRVVGVEVVDEDVRQDDPGEEAPQGAGRGRDGQRAEVGDPGARRDGDDERDSDDEQSVQPRQWSDHEINCPPESSEIKSSRLGERCVETDLLDQGRALAVEVELAVREQLGTTSEAFTRAWRASLARRLQ